METNTHPGPPVVRRPAQPYVSPSRGAELAFPRRLTEVLSGERAGWACRRTGAVCTLSPGLSGQPGA